MVIFSYFFDRITLRIVFKMMLFKAQRVMMYSMGDDGNDKITGDGGSDRLFGGPDNDILKVNAGANFLVGGKGDDELYGGLGSDVLIGRKGADTFDCGENFDIVIDFDLDDGDIQNNNCEVIESYHDDMEIFPNQLRLNLI